ncbi:HypC/HybG/HupF family hydrogenase formation chaperone [Candidatus Micrarchaeota archaeon]|nr:HypC/HybG/HupF family hydrogenase formation chaperone [Candidatus Micrarchaeota archaeon]MBU2476322.1 HypC/HybG/HupF family hydrogenase formation chaperone [Candidatus Micrarchaeota archaeon]
MCLALAGKVAEVKENGMAEVEIKGKKITAMNPEKIRKGEYVLVQQGIIIEKISEKEALC